MRIEGISLLDRAGGCYFSCLIGALRDGSDYSVWNRRGLGKVARANRSGARHPE